MCSRIAPPGHGMAATSGQEQGKVGQEQGKVGKEQGGVGQEMGNVGQEMGADGDHSLSGESYSRALGSRS